EMAQPAVFVTEYALARLLIHWGVKPDAMLGYSLGEYVAATLAGVLSLEDALTLVARRAQLIASQPPGAMLSVALSESEIHAYLQQWPQIEVDLAVVAAPQTSVLAGPIAMIEQLRHHLLCDEIACHQVETTHAFHSRMLSPVKKQLTRLVRGMALCPPAIPYISNVTGTWITDEQATSHEYWAEHMCETVRFADGAGCLLQRSSYLFVEVGVGQTLTSFVRQHPSCSGEGMTKFIATQPAQRSEGDYAFFLTSIGRLWLAGVEPDWKSFYAGERRRRIPLPTYPFERQRYWIDVRDWRARSGRSSVSDGLALAGERKSDMSRWFSIPGWRQAPPLHAEARRSDACWLIFVDEVGIGEELARRFAAEGQRVVAVSPGRAFAVAGGTGDKSDAINRVGTTIEARMDGIHYQIDPRQMLDYRRLLQELARCQLLPTRILHCWSITAPEQSSFASVQQDLDAGFYSLLTLAQALGEIELGHCVLSVLADGIYDVLGQEQLSPAKATILGPCRVIPQEYEALSCHLIEIAPSDLLASTTRKGLIDLLAQELAIEAGERIVALRGMRRWLPTFEEVQIPEPTTPQRGLRERGVYLLTGGLGGIGLALAEYLASSVHARLVLISREGLPPRNIWPELLRSHAGNERTRQQIKAIMAMEQHGAEVLVMAADVTDEAQMRQVFEQTQATFGTLNGVLHLAGIPGAGLIQLKTRESAAQVLAPKVQGTLVLHRLLQGVPLDFLLLFSSITTVTGGPGQVDYSAANAFLDAYARSRYGSYPVAAIDWSEWQWNAWSEALAGYNESTRAFFEENRRTYGITFQEGASVLQRLLTQPFPQVIVSTQDVQSLVDLSHRFTITKQLPWIRSEPPQTVAHARPPLKNSYIAPRNDDERKMVRIWEAVLAIDGIGIYDNFFDLGGNSLLGVNLLLQVRKAFSLEHLPAYVLYEAPCVETMARHLTQDKQTTAQDVLDERSSKRQSRLKKRLRVKSA
ncbi:MAG TPA: SDR family NAD(P)-dependent oxidoreductase, partial [Ktedonobacteraceae bacterium]|nr:SDR family NAD(P)-dependent oxidoreductase [Ktedonobacteraceae bacterium]